MYVQLTLLVITLIMGTLSFFKVDKSIDNRWEKFYNDTHIQLHSIQFCNISILILHSNFHFFIKWYLNIYYITFYIIIIFFFCTYHHWFYNLVYCKINITSTVFMKKLPFYRTNKYSMCQLCKLLIKTIYIYIVFLLFIYNLLFSRYKEF